ncbi:uncharacterized protein LOC114266157 [Camellia sinensis]|uniref:uncharacterized protein LOC114266157 n=1 Tax=Camellia sinensis TaxID=4442 RepID=UPI001035F1F7|nr:uncharacterized protein LOC114266157 [Camellia sinensis]
MEDEDNNSRETGVPLGDASTRGSKVDSKLVMDYSNEFVTREKSDEGDIREYLEGHSYVGRLSHEETSLLVDMSKSMVRSSEILVTLKQHDDANASTMKTMYNAHHRYKVAEKARRSQMQQLLGQLAMNKYIEWHRSCADAETVTDLLFEHPTSSNLLCAFPKALLMDCTFKTNRYRLPFLEIVGVTLIDMTFSVAFAYL